MAQVTGTISEGATVLFREVSIDLQPTNPPGEPESFRGEFEVPEGGAFYSIGRSCQLKCTDGRSGPVLISSVCPGRNQQVRVVLATTGPFV